MNPLNRMRHIPGQPLTYLQNPKVACTSIELTLWRAYDPEGVPKNPHVRDAPFHIKRTSLTPAAGESLLNSRFFSVVRNPYARLLSAYLDKVLKRPWERISRSFGVDPRTRPSLSEFLAILLSCDSHTVDHHFRPQYVNLLHGFAPLDFLGFMERMGEVRDFLQSYGFTLETYDRHATNAASLVTELLGPREAESVRRYYAEDFRSDDLGQQAPVRKAPPLSTDRLTLRRFIQTPKPDGAAFRIAPERPGSGPKPFSAASIERPPVSMNRGWRVDSGASKAGSTGSPRNAPCPCGSGRKFKYCHGRLE